MRRPGGCSHHLAEGVGEGEADAQQQAEREEVREPGRVLERMRPVGVEEPASVGAELLDGLHEADRADGDGLGHVVQDVVDVNRTAQCLYRALADEDEPEDKGDRQFDVEQAARDVHPEVADRRGVATYKAADERYGHRDSHSHAHELLNREGGHLRQVRHRRLAGVVLPVGVRHERDSRVPGQGRRHCPEVLRVERKRALDPHDQVGDHDRYRGEGDQCPGVTLPALFLLGAGAESPVDRSLDPSEPVHAAIEDSFHVRAEESPREGRAPPRGRRSSRRTASEPLRLEHGDAEIDERQYRDDEQHYLNGVHTLSNAQIRPKKKSTKATVPTTASKSPMCQASCRSCKRNVKFPARTVNSS